MKVISLHLTSLGFAFLFSTHLRVYLLKAITLAFPLGFNLNCSKQVNNLSLNNKNLTSYMNNLQLIHPPWFDTVKQNVLLPALDSGQRQMELPTPEKLCSYTVAKTERVVWDSRPGRLITSFWVPQKHILSPNLLNVHVRLFKNRTKCSTNYSYYSPTFYCANTIFKTLTHAKNLEHGKHLPSGA